MPGHRRRGRCRRKSRAAGGSRRQLAAVGGSWQMVRVKRVEHVMDPMVLIDTSHPRYVSLHSEAFSTPSPHLLHTFSTPSPHPYLIYPPPDLLTHLEGRLPSPEVLLDVEVLVVDSVIVEVREGNRGGADDPVKGGRVR